MNEMDVSKLIENAIEKLNVFSLKPSTIAAYKHRAFNPVRLFFDKREEKLYSTELSAAFLTMTNRLFELQQISATTKRFRVKGVSVLDELYLGLAEQPNKTLFTRLSGIFVKVKCKRFETKSEKTLQMASDQFF